MTRRAPAIRPIAYRKFTVEQPDLDDPEHVSSRALPPVCIEAGRMIYDVDPIVTGRSSYWKHGVERIERHPLWVAADLAKVSRKDMLVNIEMAWDCRIPRITPEGESAGLVLTFEREIFLPPKRRYGHERVMQVAFLPGERGYVLNGKPSLKAALAHMVVGVGFMATEVSDDDAEALISLTF